MRLFSCLECDLYISVSLRGRIFGLIFRISFRHFVNMYCVGAFFLLKCSNAV